MKISKNPYLFLKFEWRLKMKMQVLWVKMVVLRKGEAEKTKRFARDAREIEKFLKNCLRFNLIYAKHAFFTTHMTREQVTKIPCARFWKISLRLFRDLDFQSLVNREPLWVTSRLDFHSQKWVTKMTKTQKFWKIF